MHTEDLIVHGSATCEVIYAGAELISEVTGSEGKYFLLILLWYK